MWFRVRHARSLNSPIFDLGPNSWSRNACAVLLLLFAALESSSLSAQAVAPAATETRRSASETGIADPRLDARVESLLHRMTLQVKIGQLAQYSAAQPTGYATGRTDYKDLLPPSQ